MVGDMWQEDLLEYLDLVVGIVDLVIQGNSRMELYQTLGTVGLLNRDSRVLLLLKEEPVLW
jgi:hypothetical protein